MIRPFALLPLIALSVSALAAAPEGAAVADKAVALRCAAAFGIVANEQARGVKSALEWPDLRSRGREFFVQLGARIMDEEGLDRPAMQARYKAEVEKLQAEAMNAPEPAAVVRRVMEPCLRLLDAAVPPGAAQAR